MRITNVDRAHPNVTVRTQIAGVYDDVLILRVPATFFFRVRDNTSLIAKLFRADGVEIAPHSTLHLGYRIPGEVGVTQVGQEMSYAVFRDLTIALQRDLNTVAGRIIQMSDEEHARAERFEKSILTGLSAGYEIVIRVNSPDIVAWAGTASQISFQAERLNEAEMEADKAMRLQLAEQKVVEEAPAPVVGGAIFD